MKKQNKTIMSVLAFVMAFSLILSNVGISTVQAAKKKETTKVTVSTQAQLKKALNDKKIKTIIIKSSKTKKLKINEVKAGAQKSLIINSSKVTVTNTCTFKSIKIMSATKLVENGKNNNIIVENSAVSMSIGKNSVVKSVTYKNNGQANKITINGSLSKINIAKNTKLTIVGTTKKVPKVTVSGKKTVITTTVPVNVAASVDTKIVLNKGAENSNLSSTVNGVNISVENNTTQPVKVIDANGKETVIQSSTDKDSSNDDSKPEDENNKPEDENSKPEDENSKPEDENSKTEDEVTSPGGISGGVTGGGSYAGGSSSSVSGSNIEADSTDIENKIKSANSGDTITLSTDVNHSVTAEWDGNGTITINFNGHKITGDLTVTALNATNINLVDKTKDSSIGGKLTVNTPKAHVENSVAVKGDIDITAVSKTTFVVNADVEGSINLNGTGTLKIADSVNYGDGTNQKVNVNTSENVKLEGAVRYVTVKRSEAKIQVETPIESLTVDAAAKSEKPIEITGSKKIEKIKASAPVSIAVEVSNVVVNSNDAKIEIANGKSVDQVTVSKDVTTVNLVGEGTVAKVDVTAAENGITVSSEKAVETLVTYSGQTCNTAEGTTINKKETGDSISYTINNDAPKKADLDVSGPNGDGEMFYTLRLKPGDKLGDYIGAESGKQIVLKSAGNLTINYDVIDRTGAPDWDDPSKLTQNGTPKNPGYYSIRVYSEQCSFKQSVFLWLDIETIKDTITHTIADNNEKYEHAQMNNGEGKMVDTITLKGSTKISDVLQKGGIMFTSKNNLDITISYYSLQDGSILEQEPTSPCWYGVKASTTSDGETVFDYIWVIIKNENSN